MGRKTWCMCAGKFTIDQTDTFQSEMSSKETTRPSIKIPLILGSVFFVFILSMWFLQTPSKEELYGDTGKVWDFLSAPLKGWSPYYMLGLSSLLYNAYGAPYVLSEFANTILSPFLSCFLIEKLLILSFLPLSALAMWFFVRKLGCDKPLSAWISLFYIILPSFHVAVGIYEHWPIGLCYVFTPVFLRGILAIAENSPPRNRSLRTLRCGACAELHKNRRCDVADAVDLGDRVDEAKPRPDQAGPLGIRLEHGCHLCDGGPSLVACLA